KCLWVFARISVSCQSRGCHTGRQCHRECLDAIRGVPPPDRRRGGCKPHGRRQQVSPVPGRSGNKRPVRDEAASILAQVTERTDLYPYRCCWWQDVRSEIHARLDCNVMKRKKCLHK